jgi:acyl-CoA synthetase (NDP forming)
MCPVRSVISTIGRKTALELPVGCSRVTVHITIIQEHEELRRMQTISTLLNAGTRTLSEHDSKQVLAEYGIPVAVEKTVDTEFDAVTAATAIGYPVVLKASGAALIHKTRRSGSRTSV